MPVVLASLQVVQTSLYFNSGIDICLTDKRGTAFVTRIMTSYLRYAHFLSNIHLVICDMDGLLLDTERLSEDSFRQTSSLFDLAFDTKLFSALTGQSGLAHRQILAHYLPDEIDTIAFDRHWKQIYDDSLSEDVPVKPVAADFLQDIQQAEVPVAVATSSSTDKAIGQLTRAGLMPFLDLITGGDQVTHAKPDPEIYQKVMTVFGAVSQQVLVLEDSNNGVRAGLAAGAKTIQIPDRLPPDPVFLDSPDYHKADSLAAVRSALSVETC